VASIWQVTWAWTGFPGATGYSNLYYRASTSDAGEAAGVCQQSQLLWTGLKGLLPQQVTISLQPDVRLLEDSTGNLVNIFTVTGIPPTTGSAAAGVYSAPSGGCIDWLTGVIHGKHLMVGRTFVVPLAGAAYQNNGTLADTTVTTLATAAESMRQANPAHPFGVWGRPRKADNTSNPPKPALTGFFANAISSRIPDKAVVLRSRRD
jgi:hypothetical protein